MATDNTGCLPGADSGSHCWNLYLFRQLSRSIKKEGRAPFLINTFRNPSHCDFPPESGSGRSPCQLGCEGMMQNDGLIPIRTCGNNVNPDSGNLFQTFDVFFGIFRQSVIAGNAKG